MTITSLFARRLARLLATVLLLAAPGLQAQEVVYYHTDALGSVVAVTDASRNVLERNEYEPYGKVINHALKDGPGYTGHVADAATGMIYMQQRYYDDDIGEFPSVDPVSATSVGGTFNRYWYADNNPYSFKDPDGRQSVSQAAYVPIKGTPEQVAEVHQNSLALTLKVAVNLFLSQFQDGPGGLAAGPVGAFTKVESGISALVRAKEIQSALNPRTQRAVTTAVAETAEGIRVVGTSEGKLRPAQQAALQAGEIAPTGARGTHAEINAVNGAKEAGLTPTSVSPSRPACAGC